MDAATAADTIGGLPVSADVNAQDARRALYAVDLSRFMGPDYAPLANDVVRMISIQCAIQLLNVVLGGAAFFSADFLTLVFYIVLGVALYWLAVRRVVVFA
jgi:hypothetical protein